MEQEDEVFREALIGKKIPVLTLDNQWHRLFTQTGVSEEIQQIGRASCRERVYVLV